MTEGRRAGAAGQPREATESTFLRRGVRIPDALAGPAYGKAAGRLIHAVAEESDPDALATIALDYAVPEGVDASDRRVWHHLLVTRVALRLAQLDTEAATAALVRMYERVDTEQARVGVLSGLAPEGRPLRPPELTLLLRGLQDEHTSVRTRAAQVLAHVGSQSPEAIPKLLEMLSAPVTRERLTAARALAAMHDPSARSAVRAARRREWRPWIRFRYPRLRRRPDHG